jgi:hypothetical protein
VFVGQYEDRVKDISVSGYTRDFVAIAGAIKQKYGNPKKYLSVKTNGFGVKFACTTLVWDNSVSRIKAESVGDKADLFDIYYVFKPLYDKEKKDRHMPDAKDI